MSFNFVKGCMFVENVAVQEIAEQVGTPFYCYSTKSMRSNITAYQAGLAGLEYLLAYAVKANSNVSVLKTFASLGAGADIVSGGELKRALAAGIPPNKIVFSGVGKTHEEMAMALDACILQFNVESLEELERLNAVAASKSVIAPVSIRVNPDIAAGGHSKISTGRSSDKFGIPFSLAQSIFANSRAYTSINLVGLDVHIGSQITKAAPFRQAFNAALIMVNQLLIDGHSIKRLDIGGGLGVAYDGSKVLTPEEYGALAKECLGDLNVLLIIEPGRSLVADAGILVSTVISTKSTDGQSFLIVDAAMNDLMRPALYDAVHNIVPVKSQDGTSCMYDVVGPVCESSDIFVRKLMLPKMAAGDLVAIKSAGAYGASLSNEYNSRPLVPEVLVNGSEWSIIRNRPTYEDMIARDIQPPWLSANHHS